MSTLASLKVDLIGSSAVFRSEMIRGQRQANQSLGRIQAESRKTAESIQAISRAAMGFIGFEAVKRSVEGLLDAQVKMQAIHYTLLAATGSAQQAGDAFDFVRAESEKLGLSLEPTAEGFARLSASATALHVPMQQQKALFDAFAKASTTLHLSTENSNRALLALEQMFAKGRIQAQELRLQLGQAIPGAAARFQQAVLQMTKGTDLQGKSFDQLLKNGELYTDKFLPALVQSLQESSRGWEEASNSLNAQLNRLRTAWFNLKADVSGGLFNDAAIQSVKFMAQHLDALASAAGVAGAVVGARFAGKGLAAGANKISKLQGLTAARIADAQAAATQAQRELAVASAQASSAATARAKTETLIASLKQTLATDIGEKERTATLNRLGTATTRLVGQNIAYRDSLAGVAAAQQAAKVSEAELAAARSASTIGSAAKGFGNFALGLVGGVWGAAALAVGAFGYAIYKARKEQEEANKAFREQIATLKQMPQHIKDVTEAYKELGSTVTPSQLLSEWKTSFDARQKQLEDIAKLRKEIADMENMQGRVIYSGAASIRIDNTDELKRAKDRLAALEAQAAPTKRAFLAMSDTLRQQLGPAFDDVVKKAREFDGQKFDDFYNSLSTATKNAIQNLQQLRGAFNDGMSSLQSMAESYQRQVEDSGKTNAQKAINEVRRRALAIYQQPGSAASKKEMIDQIIQEGAAAIKAGRALDALTASRKHSTASVHEAVDAYANLRNHQNEQIQSLQQQLAGGEKLSQAQRDLNLMLQGGDAAFRKLNAAEKAEAITKQQQIVMLTNGVKARQDQNKALEREAQIRANLADMAANQALRNSRQLEGIGHGQQWNQQAQAIEQIRDAYARMRKEARAAYDADIRNNVDATLAAKNRDKAIQLANDAEAAAVSAQMQQFAALGSARADWTNGLNAAMEDFITNAENMAQHAQEFVDRLTSGFADAFTQFATGAESAKKAFGDWIDQMLADAMRFVANQAIAALFKAIQSQNADNQVAIGTSAQSVGFWGSLFSAFAGMFSGGRANGGPVNSGSLYRVNENGPELFQSRGKTYLMTGNQHGSVTPLRSGGAGAVTNINVNVQPTTTRRTAQQIAQEVDRKQRIATARNS